MNFKRDSHSRQALLVEDDPIFQEALRQVFHGLNPNWSVICFDTAGSALQGIADCTDSPELMLVDIGLPDASGIDVIRAARKRFTELPVMVVTVIASARNLITAIRAGACGYLIKGDPSITLQRSIEEVLQGNYPVSPSLARHLFNIAYRESENTFESDAVISPRETQLLRLLADGKSYAECAGEMDVALSTVQSHVRNMYRKLEVNSQMQAVVKARRLGVI